MANDYLSGGLTPVPLALAGALSPAPNFLDVLQGLLPPGAPWTRELDAELTKLIRALAFELLRVHLRADRLLEEADPSQALELLPDWERVAGLPDAYFAPVLILDRQAALVARLSFRGDQSRASYVAAAKQLGYDIEIQEFQPFSCTSTCVDSLAQGFPFTCISSCVDLVGQSSWAFTWKVNTSHGSNDALLEGMIRSRAQLHTTVLFSYD